MDYFWHRYYNSTPGRFTQVDPLWQKYPSLSPYVYAGNNPLKFVDPDGKAIAPWDAVDVVSFGHSAYEFYQNPSWENAGWLALDAVGLLPIIPAVGALKYFDKAIDVVTKPLKFGADDLVYGPSAGGKLRDLQQQAGGKLLQDVVQGPVESWLKESITAMEDALSRGNKIHFDLTNMDELEDVLKGTGKYADTITGQELRYIQNNWGRFEDSVEFYRNGSEVADPW